MPIKTSYPQDWPTYNEAQMTESSGFLVLLHELCRGVDEPIQKGPGRRRTAMADMVFACALKFFSTFSSRRFHVALKDAIEKRYISQKTMHSVSVCSFLENELMTPVLNKLIIQSSLPMVPIERIFAPDSTGFSTSRFVRWIDEKYGVERSGKDWVKAHVMCGLHTHIVTCVEIYDRSAGDNPQFKSLLETTAQNFVIKEIAADKAYLAHGTFELVEKYGGSAYIPFKSNSLPGDAGSAWEKMYLMSRLRHDEFLTHYHQRSNVETMFSMVKAKFRDHVRSKTDVATKNEVLCKFLCHNICRVHYMQVKLGIEADFWKDPKVLPFEQQKGKRHA